MVFHSGGKCTLSREIYQPFCGFAAEMTLQPWVSMLHPAMPLLSYPDWNKGSDVNSVSLLCKTQMLVLQKTPFVSVEFERLSVTRCCIPSDCCVYFSQRCIDTCSEGSSWSSGEFSLQSVCSAPIRKQTHILEMVNRRIWDVLMMKSCLTMQITANCTLRKCLPPEQLQCCGRKCIIPLFICII